jgi:hypothetical protein
MQHFRTPPVRQLFAPRGSLFFTRTMRPSGFNLRRWFFYGLGVGIRWAERTKNEKASWANHVGVVVRSGYMTHPEPGASAVVSEAQWHINEHEWWKAHGHENVAVAVFRPRNLTPLQESLIVNNAQTRTGDRYAWWRLFTFLGEKITGRRFSKAHVLERRNVCSNHAGLALESAGVYLPEPPGQLDPDDIMDHCEMHPHQYEFMGWSVVPEIPE